MDPAPSDSIGGPNGVALDDVKCPKCAYNLRGLSEARCPECGASFRWDEICDPTRRIHPYLFEHHPERNVRSFVQTLIGGFRPRRFWRSLHLTQPSSPRRFAAYAALVGAMLCAATFLAAGGTLLDIALESQREAQRWNASLSSFPVTGPWEREDFAHHLRYAFGSGRVPELLICAIAPIAWIPATWLVLWFFNRDRRRPDIGGVEFARCVIHSFDVFAVAAWLFLLGWADRSLRASSFLSEDQANMAAGLLGVGAVLIANYRLFFALRNYLHRQRPLAAVVLSQFLVLALALVLLVVLESACKRVF